METEEIVWQQYVMYLLVMALVFFASTAFGQIQVTQFTIIIFKDGGEGARLQADLSFKMLATKEEVQDEIDNILMSDF